MTAGKTIALTRCTFVSEAISLFLICCLGWSQVFFQGARIYKFHGCSHHLQWFWSPRKSVTLPIVSPSICYEVIGPDAMILVFWMLSFKPAFSLYPFTLIKKLFSSSSLSAIRVVLSTYMRLLKFLPAILIPACVSSRLAFKQCTLHISWMSRVTTYSLDVLLSQFGTSPLLNVWF